jgi:hypothetical protein
MNKLLSIVLLVFLSLSVAACNETQIVQTTKYLVVHPDEAMYHCPVLKQFPEWKTLTDKEVAKTVLTLYKNNITCKSSIESIRKFINDSDVIVKKGGN